MGEVLQFRPCPRTDITPAPRYGLSSVELVAIGFTVGTLSMIWIATMVGVTVYLRNRL